MKSKQPHEYDANPKRVRKSGGNDKGFSKKEKKQRFKPTLDNETHFLCPQSPLRVDSSFEPAGVDLTRDLTRGGPSDKNLPQLKANG